MNPENGDVKYISISDVDDLFYHLSVKELENFIVGEDGSDYRWKHYEVKELKVKIEKTVKFL